MCPYVPEKVLFVFPFTELTTQNKQTDKVVFLFKCVVPEKQKLFLPALFTLGWGIALHELVKKKKSNKVVFFFNNFQHVKRLSPNLTFTENLPSTIYFLSKQPTPYTSNTFL